MGWVEFEPTASQPEIDRSRFETELTAKQPPDERATELLFRFRLERVTSLLLPAGVLLLGLIIYYLFIERWRYLRLAPAAAIEKIFRRLYRLGRPLAGERTRAETAYEFMQKLIYKMNTLSEHARLAKIIHPAQDDIRLLTELYQDTLFSHNNIRKNDARKALKMWRHVRWRLAIARIYVMTRRRSPVPQPGKLDRKHAKGRLLRKVHPQ
jgi:hypothetical protein